MKTKFYRPPSSHHYARQQRQRGRGGGGGGADTQPARSGSTSRTFMVLVMKLVLSFLLISSIPTHAAAAPTGVPAASPASNTGAAGSSGAYAALTALPGCSPPSGGAALAAELSGCIWSVQMKRHASLWYTFDIAPGTGANMSVLIMGRALSGQITMCACSRP